MLSSPGASSKGKGKQVQISLAINRTMSFDGASIPDDIWLTVFDLLGPAELGSLSRTCTKFHQLTQRPLLREITWSRAPSAQRNVADWGTGGSLAQFTGIPRKVNIRLNFKKVNQNGALVATVDWEFYDAAFQRLISFTNLRSLELVDTILTPAVYPVLAAIPSLRELNITRCTFIWSPLYPAILSTLGRPIPPGGIPDLYTTTRGDQSNVPAQRQWFIDNHTFDFSTRLNHLTHLTFKYNRMDQFSESLNRFPEDAPYPPSEIGKPCILHPLYLLAIPTLADVTLSWSPNLVQVLDTLKQNFDFSQTNQPGNPQQGIIPPPPMFAQGIPPNALANALHAANPFGLNVFVPLRPNFPALNHVSLLVDDLSRDTMDSLVSLFERRVNSPAPGLAQLRSILRVGKHTLTEQHIGTIQFKLPGVYHYEGPLVIAGLLAAGSEALNTVNAIEEIRMTEALDMTSVLFNLEKLPNTLKKLDIRVFKWDQEILYAVRALFKGLVELVIRYGRGGLSENTHVILGSDILPELKKLHTLRILPSTDCVKRDQQRFPFNPSSPFGMHSFTSTMGGGHVQGNAAWWATSPSINGNNNHHHHPGGGGVNGIGGIGGGGGGFLHHHHHHHHHTHHVPHQGNMNNNVVIIPSDMNVDEAEVDTDEDEEDDDEFDGDAAAQFALMDQLEPSGRMTEAEQDALYDALEAEEAALDDLDDVQPPPRRPRGRAATSSAAASASGSSTANASGTGTGSATSNVSLGEGTIIHHHHPLAFGSIPARGATRGGFRGRGGHTATLSSFSTLGSWEVPATTSNSPGPSTAGTIIGPSSPSSHPTTTISPTGGRHRYGWTSQPRTSGPVIMAPTVTATPAPTTSASTMRSTSTRSRTGASMTASSTSRSNTTAHAPSSASTERNPHRSSTEQDEQSRITASLIEDLGDYLVGWNRHCPSLRIVQIDHNVVWTRRFHGDSWRPEDPRGGMKGNKKSRKGKERAI